MGSTLHDAFWSWALDRYDGQTLRDCLLELQESVDLVVIEAMFAAWLSERGRQLSMDEAKQIERSIAPWVENVLLPIRCQRVKWRGCEESKVLRAEALRLELQAEKTLAKLLCNALSSPFEGPALVSYRSNLALIRALSSPVDLDRLVAAFER